MLSLKQEKHWRLYLINFNYKNCKTKTDTKSNYRSITWEVSTLSLDLKSVNSLTL